MLIKTISEMNEFALSNKDESIGFVPTMGSLHSGHLSLVEKSNKENQIAIVSIFVNPTQFGVNEDFSTYPRDIRKDLDLLSDYKVDAVFCPEYEDIYPKDYKTFVEVHDYSKKYCGVTRPDHFRGVATVVCKLLNIVKPTFMYMGEKDFQQIFILEKMILDLNMSTKIIRCPIVRESDGLAMSSRNIYLDISERQKALCLYQSLLLAKKLFNEGEIEIEHAKNKMAELIEKSNGIIDYIAFVNNNTFNEVKRLTKDTRALLAVKIGRTRLIDNMLLGEK